MKINEDLEVQGPEIVIKKTSRWNPLIDFFEYFCSWNLNELKFLGCVSYYLLIKKKSYKKVVMDKYSTCWSNET